MPHRGKKKTKKNLQLRKLSLSLQCCLAWGQFCVALAALFKTKNRMFECFLSHTTIQTQGNIKHFCVVFPVWWSSVHCTGIIFLFLWDITHIHSVLNWLQHLGWRKHLFFNTSIIGIYQTRTMRVCLRIIILGSLQAGETYWIPFHTLLKGK